MAENQDPEQPKKYFTLPKVSIGLGVAGTGIWGFSDFEAFKGLISEAWKQNMTQMLIAFFLAGIAHRFIFKKDIANQLMKIVGPVVDALNAIADKSHMIDEKMGEINLTVKQHGDRIVAIEQHLTVRNITGEVK